MLFTDVCGLISNFPSLLCHLSPSLSFDISEILIWLIKSHRRIIWQMRRKFNKQVHPFIYSLLSLSLSVAYWWIIFAIHHFITWYMALECTRMMKTNNSLSVVIFVVTREGEREKCLLVVTSTPDTIPPLLFSVSQNHFSTHFSFHIHCCHPFFHSNSLTERKFWRREEKLSASHQKIQIDLLESFNISFPQSCF